MLVHWLWSGGWDGPWSFTAAILDELDCPLKPDLWSRGRDSSLGLLCWCYSRVGPSSALVVKQRLGGPTRALKVLLKADWPTSIMDPIPPQAILTSMFDQLSMRPYFSVDWCHGFDSSKSVSTAVFWDQQTYVLIMAIHLTNGDSDKGLKKSVLNQN